MTREERRGPATESTDPDDGSAGERTGRSRRATVETTHEDPALVAAALEPDNTDEMATRVAGDRVVTTVERDATGGLRSTVDDYVVNLAVAERTVRATKRTTDTTPNDTP